MKNYQRVCLCGLMAFGFCLMQAMGAITVVSTNFGLEYPSGVDGITIDADGNLLIYGGFQIVNGVFCQGVARLDADGSLDTAWRPLPDGFVQRVIPAADGIYLAGQFEHIAGVRRFSLAKVRTDTGSLIAEFNPEPSESVKDIALLDDSLYAGGAFTNIGGQASRFVARLNTATGVAAASFTNGPVWEASQVMALAADETGVYIGGLFFDIGDEPRMSIGKVSSTTGNPIPDTFLDGVGGFGMVQRLHAHGNHVYASGFFDEIGGEERISFARLNRSTGSADAGFACGITNEVDGGVLDCAVTSGGVFVGGNFTNYAGNRDYLAKVSLTDGSLIPAFNAQVDADVTSLTALPDGNIAIGGYFTEVNGRSADGVAVVNGTTGADVPGFAARVADIGVVYAATRLADGGWIMGGDFELVHGIDSKYLARFDAAGALVESWVPNPDGIVRSLVVDGDYIYVGGTFNQIAGQARTNIAKLRLDNGALVTSFGANANAAVYALAIAEDALFAGGNFTSIGGGERLRLAKLDKHTGAFDPAFTGNANNYVSEIVVDGAHLYAAGAFTLINAVDCGRVTRLDIASGAADATWSSNAFSHARVSAMAVTSAAVYVGGDFTNIGGVARASLAKLNKNDGIPDANWNPGSDKFVFSLAVFDDYVYVGGNFDEIGGHAISNAARVRADTGAVDTTWVPAPVGGTVNGFNFHQPYIAMHGGFFEMAGELQQGFAVVTHGLPQTAITEPDPAEDHWCQSVAYITLQAQAQADAGMSITQVVYYADGMIIGAATTAPYTVVWSPVYEGQYKVTALAYDNTGLVGEMSDAVHILVTPLVTAADFDGDGKADPALHVILPGTDTGAWYVWLSGSGYTRVGPRLSGMTGWEALAGDVDGDGKADPVLWWFDQSGGIVKNAWYVWRSGMNYSPQGPVYLGAAGLYPVLSDFDGDGRADPTIYKTDGTYNIWRTWRSGSGYADSGDIRLGTLIEGTPLAADFDGDGRGDPAVCVPSVGDTPAGWYVWLSGNNYQRIGPRYFPAPAGAIPLAADFDGDGRADPAVYVPALDDIPAGWYVWLSGNNYQRSGPFSYTAPD